MTFTEDLDAFLADFGVAVSSGSLSGLGVLDMPDDLIATGDVVTAGYSVQVKSSIFSGLKRGDSVTVDSVSYTVREFRKIDDGNLGRIYLSKT